MVPEEPWRALILRSLRRLEKVPSSGVADDPEFLLASSILASPEEETI